MKDENDQEASFWNMFKLLAENEGKDGLTAEQIWSLLEQQVKEEGYEPTLVYLVGLNGTFKRSLWRARNAGILEQAAKNPSRFKATERGTHHYMKFHTGQVRRLRKRKG